MRPRKLKSSDFFHLEHTNCQARTFTHLGRENIKTESETPPGLSCQFCSPSLPIHGTQGQMQRGVSSPCPHTLCQPDPLQTNQELWSATTDPAEVPNSSKLSEPGLTGVEDLSVLSSSLTGSLLQCQLWDRIRRIKFLVWRMIKRGDFTSEKCCQKLKVNKLMVNVFSAVPYFKLKIKINISTALCVHMLLLTTACSCCLRRFIPRLITVSFQSKSVRSIWCCIWPFSL